MQPKQMNLLDRVSTSDVDAMIDYDAINLDMHYLNRYNISDHDDPVFMIRTNTTPKLHSEQSDIR